MNEPQQATPVDVPMSFQSPESSTIVSATYDPEQRVLTVVFKREKMTSKSVYIYGGVDPSVWADFHGASSKGTFFAQRIRPMFLGRAKDSIT